MNCELGGSGGEGGGRGWVEVVGAWGVMSWGEKGDQPLTALFSLCAFNFERASHLPPRSPANICSSYICPLYNSNRYDIY